MTPSEGRGGAPPAHPGAIESIEDSLHRVGPSLRVRALLVLTGVTILPIVVASVAAYVAEPDPFASAAALLREAQAASRAFEGSGDVELRAVETTLARRQASAGGRYHWIDAEGRVRVRVGTSHRPNLIERAQAFLFGDDELPPAPPLEHVDASSSLRDAFALARERGEHHACETASEGRQLVCRAIVRAGPGYVLVERAQRRTVGALVEHRYQFLRLSFFLLPWALLSGAWLAWRMIRPLERLRREVERRAEMASPTADLPTTRKDEIGALAHEFNRLAARLAQRSAAHEAFVADLAHEFKNPVAAIRSASEKLAEGPDDPARIERLSRVVQASSDRLQRVLNDFLDLAHAEAGWGEGELEPVDVAALVPALVDRAQASAAHANKRIRWDRGGSEDDGMWTRAVPERLEVAVMNLLDNALAFARTEVAISVERHDTWVCVKVLDDGPGIASEDLGRVFDRFFTQRRGAGGTGLGLPLARAIVESHGGRITVDSPGGARFIVWLPAHSS